MSVLGRDGIHYSMCKLHTTLKEKAVTISTSKTITICSLYLPPNEYLNIVLLCRLMDQLPTSFVICGDFNGHSVTWGCNKNNSRGDRIRVPTVMENPGKSWKILESHGKSWKVMEKKKLSWKSHGN